MFFTSRSPLRARIHLVSDCSLPSMRVHLSNFHSLVRHRDLRRVVTGDIVKGADADEWSRFGAAHIVPLAHEDIFLSQSLHAFVARQEDDSGIHSPQNGLLLRADIHQLFDQYALSVNPFVSVPISFKLSPIYELTVEERLQDFQFHVCPRVQWKGSRHGMSTAQ